MATRDPMTRLREAHRQKQAGRSIVQGVQPEGPSPMDRLRAASRQRTPAPAPRETRPQVDTPAAAAPPRAPGRFRSAITRPSLGSDTIRPPAPTRPPVTATPEQQAGMAETVRRSTRGYVQPGPTVGAEAAKRAAETVAPEQVVGLGDRFQHAANRFAGTYAAEMPASILEGVAVLSKELDVFGEYEDQEAGDLATAQAAARIREWAEQTFPGDERLQGEFLADVLPAAFGSAGAFMTGGVAGKALGMSGGAVAGAMGALGSTGGAYREAKNLGADEEAARLAGLLNLPLGATEAIPVERALGRLASPSLSDGLARRLAKGFAAGAAEESLQEGVQNVGGNVIAKEVYDPERDVTEGLGTSIAAGALTGGVLSGGMAGAGGAIERRRRAAAPDATDAEIEAGPSPMERQEQRKGGGLRARLAGVIHPEGEQERQELKKQRDEERRAAEIDSLTGVANTTAWERARPAIEADPSLGLVFFDVRGLKAANDLVSYKKGNEVIQTGARVIEQATQEITGSPERVFRTGGDEFAVAAPMEKLERIRARAIELFPDEKIGEFPVALRAGIGATLEEADAGVRAAKESETGPKPRVMRPKGAEVEAAPEAEAPPAAPARKLGTLRPIRSARSLGRFTAPQAVESEFETMGRPELLAARADLQAAGERGEAEPERLAELESVIERRKAAARSAGLPAARAVPRYSPATETGPPPDVAFVPTTELIRDPDRFQYKATGAEGVTAELKEVESYDPALGGVILAWRDPSDGRSYVINGHHRHELAERTRYPEMLVRYINDRARTPAEARTTGAMANIAEGRGTAIDAAKLFRESGIEPADLKARGISLKGKVAQDGLALSRLAPSLFGRVATGQMSEARAVIIGKSDLAPEQQVALAQMIETAESRGRKVLDRDVEEQARFVAGAGEADITQETLFGAETLTTSLALEKAALSSYIRSRIRQDTRNFGSVSRSARAEAIEAAGVGTIDVERAKELKTAAEQAEEIYAKESLYSGDVSRTLNEGARAIAQGGSERSIREDAYEQIRGIIRAIIAGEQGSSAVGTEGADRRGDGQAEAVEPEPVDTETADMFGAPAAPAAAPAPVQTPPEPATKPTAKNLGKKRKTAADIPAIEEMIRAATTEGEVEAVDNIILNAEGIDNDEYARLHGVMKARIKAIEKSAAPRATAGSLGKQDVESIEKMAPGARRRQERERQQGEAATSPEKVARTTEAAEEAERRYPGDRVQKQDFIAGARYSDNGGTLPTGDPAFVAGFEWRQQRADSAPQSESENRPTPASGEQNTVFTKDAADNALEVLRRKLGGGELRAGLDPELMVAAITRGGYHVERGIRTFAEWSRTMVEEVGEGIRPYLRSIYSAIRTWPGFDAAGMSTDAEIAAEPVASIEVEKKEAAPAGPVTTPRTRVSWGNVSSWMEGMRQLDKRRSSSTRYEQMSEHFRALLVGHVERETSTGDLKDLRDMLKAAERSAPWIPSKNHPGSQSDRAHYVALLDAIDRTLTRHDKGEVGPVVQRTVETAAASATEADVRAMLRAGVAAIEAHVTGETPLPASPTALVKWAEGVTGKKYEQDFSLDDVYDAMEGAANEYVRRTLGPQKKAGHPGIVGRLKALAELETTIFRDRTNTAAAKARQQFSTPLPIAEAAAYAANVQPGERVLEPTAGTGNLVNAIRSVPGISVHVNEIEPRRASVLNELFSGTSSSEVTSEDALRLPLSGRRYSKVVTNPPYGSIKKKQYSGHGAAPFGATDIAQRFFAQAMQSLAPGGRIVAVMPYNTITDQGIAFRQWLSENHTPVAYIESPDGSYRTRGVEGRSGQAMIVVVDEGQRPGAKRLGGAPFTLKNPSWDEWHKAIERFSAGGPGFKAEAVQAEDVAAIEAPEAPSEPKRQATIIDRSAGTRQIEGRTASPAESEGDVESTPAGTEGIAPEAAAGARPEPRGALGDPGGPRPGEPGAGPGTGAIPGSGRDAGMVAPPAPGDAGRAAGAPEAGLVSGPSRRSVEPREGDSTERRAEIAAANDSQVFAPYAHGLPTSRAPHPRLVVETRSMAGMPAPAVTATLRSPLTDRAWGRDGSNGGVSDDQVDAALRVLSAWDKGHGMLIADDVGVGKSREAAIVILEALERGEKRILYTTKNENNVADVMAELRNVATGNPEGTFPAAFVFVGDYPRVKKGLEDLPAPDGPVVYFAHSYNFADYQEALAAVKPTVWLADEAHEFRNLHSGRGMAWGEMHRDMVERGSSKFAYFTATPAVSLDELAYLYGLRQWEIGAFGDWLDRKLGKARPKKPGDDEASAAAIAAQAAANALTGETEGEGGDQALASGKKRFMPARNDAFAQKVTPAETEQVMRELKGSGHYIARDLWRGGVEFGVDWVDLLGEGAEAAAARQRYDEAASLVRDITLAARQYGRLNKRDKGGGLERAQLQVYMKALLFNLRMPHVFRLADESLKAGRQVVISIHSVSGDEDTTAGVADARSLSSSLAAAINAINTLQVDKVGQGAEAQYIEIGDVPEAMMAVARLKERAQALPVLRDPVKAIEDNFGPSNVAAITGRQTPKRRKESMAQFQAGLRKVAIISRAGKVGISLHDVNGKARHLIVSDYEWSADLFKQELGRVDRTGQVSSPLISLVATTIAGERKFASTIAARMASLGATSKGSAESTGTDALDQFEMSGDIPLNAMRNAITVMDDPLRQFFTGSAFMEMKKREDGGWDFVPIRRPGEQADMRKFLLEMLFFPVNAADKVMEGFVQEREALMTGEAREALAARRTGRSHGEVLRRTTLAEDPELTLFEVRNAAGEKAGILQGFVTEHIIDIQQVRGPLQSGALKPRRYVHFTPDDGAEPIAGLEVAPSEARRLMEHFGQSERRQLTPDDVWSDLQAGDKVEVQGPRAEPWVLHLRRDGKIQIGGSSLSRNNADVNGLPAKTVAYSEVGNFLFVHGNQEALGRFLTRFPPAVQQGQTSLGGEVREGRAPYGGNPKVAGAVARLQEIEATKENNVVCVACGALKGGVKAAAKDLYQSDHFKKNRAAAEQLGDSWYILSAFHGLVDPETVLRPYDRTLNGERDAEKERWAQRVARDIGRQVPKEKRIVLLAGEDYRDYLRGFLRWAGYQVEAPLEGLGIGEQLSALKQFNDASGASDQLRLLEGRSSYQREIDAVHEARAAEQAVRDWFGQLYAEITGELNAAYRSATDRRLNTKVEDRRRLRVEAKQEYDRKLDELQAEFRRRMGGVPRAEGDTSAGPRIVREDRFSYPEPTLEQRHRAARIGRMALARTDDSLTMYGAEGAALLRLQKDSSRSDEEIAADIARHYRSRVPEGEAQGGFFGAPEPAAVAADADLFGEALPVDRPEQGSILDVSRGPQGRSAALAEARQSISLLEGKVARGAAKPSEVRRYESARGLIRALEGQAMSPEDVKRATEELGQEAPAADANEGDLFGGVREERAEYETRPRFYSRLQRAIEGAPFASAPASQWAGYLGKQPIAAGERDWVGIDRFLDEAEGKLTRDEVLAFARENEIEIVQTTLGGGGSAELEKATEEQREATTERFLAQKDFVEQMKTAGYGTEAIDRWKHWPPPDMPGPAGQYTPRAADERMLVSVALKADDDLGFDSTAHALNAVYTWAGEDIREMYPDASARLVLAVQRWKEATRRVREAESEPAPAEVVQAAERLSAAIDVEGHARSRYEQIRASERTVYNDSSLVLPGGSNYREILLSLPIPMKEEQVPVSRFRWKEARSPGGRNEEWFLVTEGGEWGSTPYPTKEVAEEAIRSGRATETRQVPDKSGVFAAPHFGRDNLLAWARVTDRQLKSGERVLFVEEIQSDWHQKGREAGYRQDNPAREGLLAEKMQLAEGGKLLGGHPEFDAAMRRYKEINRELQAMPVSRGDAVPDAPYKKTDEWVGLVMRRLIDEAVEGGYDRISWTRGDQQSDRYDLAHVVAAIDYDPKTQALTAIGVHGEPALDATAPPDRVHEWIGKEAAERLLASPIVEGNHQLSGERLSVGGEGMHAFYDRIVPKAAKEAAKKLGAKVEIETAPVVEGAGNYRAWWVIWDGGQAGDPPFADFDTREEAEAFVQQTATAMNEDPGAFMLVEGRGAGDNQTIRITPEISGKVRREGQMVWEGAAGYDAELERIHQKLHDGEALTAAEGRKGRKALTDQLALEFGSVQAGREAAAEVVRVAGDLANIHIPGLPTTESRRRLVEQARLAAYAWVPATGQKVRAENGVIQHESVLKLLRTYRSPSLEYMNVLVLAPDPEGGMRVAHHRMTTAGVIGMTFVQTSDYVEAAGIAKRLGGQVILAHNHPSGNPTPSAEDRDVTRMATKTIRAVGASFGGHYVINHELATLIDDNGAQWTLRARNDDPDWTQEQRGKLTGSHEVFRYLAQVPNDERRMDLLLTTMQNEIIAFEVRPIDDVESIAEWMPALMRDTGAASVIIGTGGPAAYQRVVEVNDRIGEGLGIFDVVDVSAQTSMRDVGGMAAEGTPTMRPIFEGRAGYGESTEGRASDVPQEPESGAPSVGRARQLGRVRERRPPRGDEGGVRGTSPDLSAGAERLIRRRNKPVRADLADATTLEPPPLPREAATTPEDRTLLPIAPVELARIATELLGGREPFVKKYAQWRGAFYPEAQPRIGLNAALGRDYDQFVRTLAHEVGHLIDYLPDQSMSAGNILGRLAALKGYLSHTVDAVPTDPSLALTPADRKAIRAKAVAEVKERGLDSKEAIAEAVSDLYQEMIEQEIEERGLLTREAITEELIALSEWWRPYDRTTALSHQVAYRESSPELYADALSVLLNSPGSLQTRAPRFFDAWLAYLHAKPEVDEAYDDIQALLSSGEDAIMAARKAELEADFARGEEIQRTSEAWEDPQSMASYLKQLLVDRTSPVTDAERKRLGKAPAHSAQHAAKMALEELNHSENVNRVMLQDIERLVHRPMMEAGITDEQAGRYLMLKRIAEGDRGGMAEQAKEAIQEITGKATWAEAKTAYIALQNEGPEQSSEFDPDLLELAEKGILNPRGYTPAEAKRTLDALRAELETEPGAERWDALEAAMKEFRAITFRGVEEAVKVGSYSRETFQNVILPNKDSYVPFAVLDYFTGRMAAGVKQQMGTLKGIANPYTSAILKAMTLNRLNEHQKAKIAVLSTIDVDFPGMAGPEQKVDKYRREKKPGRGRDNLTYLRDGKLHYREVDAYIAKVFERADLGAADRLVKTLASKTYGLFHPLYVSLSLAWQVRNIQRDWKRTFKNLATARAGAPTYRQALGAIVDVGKLNVAYAKTIGPAWRNARRRYDPVIREMLEDRALGRAFHSFTPNTADTKFTRLMQEYGLQAPEDGGLKGTAKRLGRAVETLGVFQETWSKAASYKLLGDMGILGKERAYIVRNYTGTPDSTRRGLASDATNTLFMYANVVVAGIRADAEVALQPQTAAGYWLRSILTDFAPKAAMAAAAAGLFGDDAEDWFARIPSYDLEKYIIIPVPPFWSTSEQGDRKAVYLRVPHDDLNRIVAGAVWAMLVGDRPHKVARSVGLVQGEFPGIAPWITLPLAWMQAAANRNPFDTFRGRNVVPRTQWEAGGWARWKEMLRYTLGEFGIISQVAGIFTQASPLEGEAAPGEKALRAVPGLSSLVKITDRGLDEARWWEEDWETQERAKIRADLSEDVRRAGSERSRLNRFGVEKLSPAERERRLRLNDWYRTYLAHTAAMETARDAGDPAGYERARFELERATESLGSRPAPAGRSSTSRTPPSSSRTAPRRSARSLGSRNPSPATGEVR